MSKIDYSKLTDKEIGEIFRDTNRTDEERDAAHREGSRRLEQAGKRKHPKDCLCVSCQSGGTDA